MGRQRAAWMVFGFLCGVVLSPAMADVVSWSRVQVMPVVMVEEHEGKFYPTSGNRSVEGWTHNEVIPMCEVKSAFGKFSPVHGDPVEWTQREVRPTVMVTPSFGVFAPIQAP